MMKIFQRWLYRQTLRLYPDSFRSEFGAEMSDVFEACTGMYGCAYLLGDALLAAVRQQLRPSTACAAGIELYAEVPSSPPLARHLAAFVFAVAIVTNALMPNRPVFSAGRTQLVESSPAEHTILYVWSASALTRAHERRN